MAEMNHYRETERDSILFPTIRFIIIIHDKGKNLDF